MNIILIMGTMTNKIVSYINNTNGVSIDIVKSGVSVDELENYLIKSLTKVDLLLINDNALGKEYMKSIIKLKNVLEKGFLTTKQIIHFTPETSNLSDYTEHILGEYNLKVIKRSEFTYNTIVSAITGELTEMKSSTKSSSLTSVVRVRRNSREYEEYEENPVNDTVIITSKSKIELDDKLDALESIKELKGDKQLSKFSQKIAPNKLEALNPSIPKNEIAEPPLKKEIKTLPKGTTVLVTGERKSGKTVFSQALAISYCKDYKVLLVSDSDTISDELPKDRLQLNLSDFKSNLSDSIIKTAGYSVNLSVINNFSSIPSDIIYPLLDIIYFNIKSNYDLIIIDVQLTKYLEMPGIASHLDLVCITSPLYTSCINSLVNFLHDINSVIYKNKFLYVPTDIFHNVGNLKKYTTRAATTAIINALKYDKVTNISEIQFRSLSVGDALLDIINPHLLKNI